MCNAHVAGQPAHVASAENIPHQALVLMHMKGTTVGGNDTRSVLATVLQNGQTVVQQLINRTFGNDSNDATHGKSFVGSCLLKLLGVSRFCG
jgi:hypothetical protein